MEGQRANAEDELILSSLPRERGWAIPDLFLFQEFWCPSILIKEVNIFQKQFQAKESDIFVASFPKSGTTWLKAITFSIVNRQRFSSIDNHPLLTSNPHQLVPAVEFMYRGDVHCPTTEPRVFGTHTPFPSLPNSIIDQSNCYWKESMAKPSKVLFLKYEDLKEDVNFEVKKIADFLGFPFTQEEENKEVIESIIKLCSFEKMKDSEVNKSGIIYQFLEKKYFFGKGETRDWVNYFSPSMIEKLSKIMEEKFGGSGLSFMI
ncbi:cytosolic sulfotransferase 14-like isoform X3 [Vigna radiata var. radiata]|uniref:Sulfotransferase n=1 Tax=Vigna radiata var. radiata TaxID=3916 RepID=A0A1S3VXL7_VIGRR|nr:cytosolic sulfotransferase 14-like isoform X3 [Vigna radiata var. radiata]